MSYPVVAAALAALLLGERITPQIAVGGLLTLGGLALVVATRADAGEAPRAWAMPWSWRDVPALARAGSAVPCGSVC